MEPSEAHNRVANAAWMTPLAQQQNRITSICKIFILYFFFILA